jgi:hypothetical protein
MLCRRYAQLGALVMHEDREVTEACVTGISDNLSGLNRAHLQGHYPKGCRY